MVVWAFVIFKVETKSVFRIGAFCYYGKFYIFKSPLKIDSQFGVFIFLLLILWLLGFFEPRSYRIGSGLQKAFSKIDFEFLSQKLHDILLFS
jgi:hypothetical protein